MHILQQLYDSEINFSISTFWDAGFDWKLGDEINGWLEQGQCNSLDAAAIALSVASKKYFPNSLFVKQDQQLKAGDRVWYGTPDDGEAGIVQEVNPPTARVEWGDGATAVYFLDALKKVE